MKTFVTYSTQPSTLKRNQTMFKVNQKVWCAIYGAGVVARIREGEVDYSVVVLFKSTGDENVITYTADGKYHCTGNVTLFPYPIEIVKAVTKPTIDWNHVSPEYNYLAQDSNGDGYLCGKNPHCMAYTWSMESPYIRATTFTSYEPGTCDWKDSLVERPS